MKTLLLAIVKAKACLRANAEPPFHVNKNLFGYRKVSYMELTKNRAQLFTLFALGNLVSAGRCQGNADGANVS